MSVSDEWDRKLRSVFELQYDVLSIEALVKDIGDDVMSLRYLPGSHALLTSVKHGSVPC